MFKHELGMLAKDRISGFEGIITSRCEFLTGCNRYCLQPRGLKDTQPIPPVYFDEEQIEVLGAGLDAAELQGEKPGNCAPDPVK